MDHFSFESTARRRRLAVAFLLALTAVLPLRLLAKGCAESLGPAQAPPQALWGDLKPTATLVDATNWTLRLPPDFASLHATRLAAGRALDLPLAIDLALSSTECGSSTSR